MVGPADGPVADAPDGQAPMATAGPGGDDAQAHALSGPG